MKKIIRLNGVTVNNDLLPRVDATDEERALASIPELFFWIQAGPRFAREAGFVDRAGGGALTTTADAQYRMMDGEFANGAPAIVGPEGTAANYSPDPEVQFNTSRWSVAVVAEVPEALPGATSGLLGMQGNHVAGVNAVRITFNHVAGIRLFGPGATETRLSYNGSQWKAGAALIVLTFSTERGLEIRVNGVSVARDETDKRALTDPRFQFGQSTPNPAHASAWHGKLGHLMLFNTDLGTPANVGYRRALESILMGFYGIT